ncbi:MAG TPA: hypothetical protein VF945_05565 [Polyangia bacterium]
MRRATVLACVLAGCGGSRAVPPPAVAHDPGYPAGPYGYYAGGLRLPPAVLPDLLFAGKIVPVGTPAASVPAQMISLGSLRDGVRFFVLDVAAEWCSDCVGDQPAMMQLEADYAAKGVLGLQVITEAAIGVPPTLDNLDRWSSAYAATGVILLDAKLEFETAAGITEFPTYYIVETSTMRIFRISTSPLVAAPLGPILDSLLAQ